MIYNFEFRRVAVNPATLQVSANLIPQLSQPVRVGGPGITWFHDTREPSPLDAARGSYTSVQEFFASSKFGSEANFNRTDVTNSTYYAFGKHKYVLARNTRLGFETTFGANPNVSSSRARRLVDGWRQLLETNAKLQRGAAARAPVCGRRDVASRLWHQRRGAARSCRRAIRWAAMRSL